MTAVHPRRPALLALAVLLALTGGCASKGRQRSQPWQCQSDGTAATAYPAAPTALGVARDVAALPGVLSLAATSVTDPLTGGDPGAGCRFVGVGVRLRNTGTVPGSIDFYQTAFAVSASGARYRPSGKGVEGRDGVDQTDLIGGDERRGTLVFQVPTGEQLRYLAVSGTALVVDLTSPASPVPVEPYRPGGWPRPGTRQTLDRLAGEKLDVTPLRVLDPTPATGGVRRGYRAYSVQLRLRVTGTSPWPLNPEHMVALVDSTARQWFTGFVTTSAAPPFETLRDQPGQEQTAWVTAEIPGDARIVALMLSPYPGSVWAWRL